VVGKLTWPRYLVPGVHRIAAEVAVPLDDFADPDKRADWLKSRNMLVFPLWDPANPLRSVDIFISEPIAFEDLLRDAVLKDLDGVQVPVASIDHLIRMKLGSGRPRDLDDIEKLRTSGTEAINNFLRPL